MVNDRIKRVTFLSLTEMCSTNKKTCLLSYSKLMRAPYFSNFKPEVARTVFRARVGVYDIKDNFKRKYDGDLNCPFCRQLHEKAHFPLQLRNFLQEISERDNTV